MKKEIIYTKGLTKIYRKGSAQINALSDINLEIGEGEFVAVMGPSGAGKSTLLNIIGCLDRPTSGNYFLAGSDISKKNDKELSRLRSQKIGFVFQSFNLLPDYTVLENVKMPFIYRNENKGSESLSAKRYHEKALSILHDMGIGDRVNHYPAELSGGEQQRAAIARALTQEPHILLADEPTGNLDSKTGGEIIDIFKKINRSGTAVIMVTHNTQLAQTAARRIYIKDGIIAHED